MSRRRRQKEREFMFENNPMKKGIEAIAGYVGRRNRYTPGGRQHA